MKFIKLSDSRTKLPVYINADSINAVYTDADLNCTVVDVQSSTLFVTESDRTVLNALYQANYDKGFLFHAPDADERDGE